MLISNLPLFLPALGLAAANKVTFISLDSYDRDVYSKHKAGCAVGDPGCEDLLVLRVPGFAHAALELPSTWEGNFYSVPAGTRDKTGMLAEIRVHGFESKSWYDVSALENPNDHDGVKQFWPANDPNAEVSGCITFPCEHAYYHPDDKETQKPTKSDDFYCTLGNADLGKYPNLAQWQMIYSKEDKKWLPMSALDKKEVDSDASSAASTHTATVEASTTTYTTDAHEEDDTADQQPVNEEDAPDKEDADNGEHEHNEEDTDNKGDVDNEEDATDETDTDTDNETTSSHGTTLLTSVKKQTATPTSTTEHGHSYTATAKHTASD